MPCFWTRLDLSRHALPACACHRYSIVDLPLYSVQAKTTAKFATLIVSSASATLDSPSGLGMVKKTSLEHKAPHSLDSCSVRRRAGYGEYRKPSVFCGLAYRLDRHPIHLPASPVIVYLRLALILKSSPVCVTNQ